MQAHCFISQQSLTVQYYYTHSTGVLAVGCCLPTAPPNDAPQYTRALQCVLMPTGRAENDHGEGPRLLAFAIAASSCRHLRACILSSLGVRGWQPLSRRPVPIHSTECVCESFPPDSKRVRKMKSISISSLSDCRSAANTQEADKLGFVSASCRP